MQEKYKWSLEHFWKYYEKLSIIHDIFKVF